MTPPTQDKLLLEVVDCVTLEFYTRRDVCALLNEATSGIRSQYSKRTQCIKGGIFPLPPSIPCNRDCEVFIAFGEFSLFSKP